MDGFLILGALPSDLATYVFSFAVVKYNWWSAACTWKVREQLIADLNWDKFVHKQFPGLSYNHASAMLVGHMLDVGEGAKDFFCILLDPDHFVLTPFEFVWAVIPLKAHEYFMKYVLHLSEWSDITKIRFASVNTLAIRSPRRNVFKKLFLVPEAVSFLHKAVQFSKFFGDTYDLDFPTRSDYHQSYNFIPYTIILSSRCVKSYCHLLFKPCFDGKSMKVTFQKLKESMDTNTVYGLIANRVHLPQLEYHYNK